MNAAVIVAAGRGARMGLECNKVLYPLCGEPIIVRTVRAFAQSGLFDGGIVVVTGACDLDEMKRMLEDAGLPVRALVEGGADRQESVYRGVQACDPAADIIAIHDGARPLVRREDIEKAFQTAQEKGSALLGVFTRDTIKVVRDGRVEASPDRSTLFLAQTPQVFRREDYLAAMAEARARGLDFTDDAQLFEQTGRPVFAVEGHADNLKITSPEDLPLAEGCLRARRNCDAENRTGI